LKTIEVLKVHPDKQAIQTNNEKKGSVGFEKESSDSFHQVLKAWKILQDSQRRKEYDAYLECKFSFLDSFYSLFILFCSFLFFFVLFCSFLFSYLFVLLILSLFLFFLFNELNQYLLVLRHRDSVVITSEIDIADFDTLDELTDVIYSYPCRCGGRYVITQNKLLCGIEVIPCEDCSLYVKILFDLEEE
jgi:curved DNA-binding protein CbpA